jgi:hypothetical protein
MTVPNDTSPAADRVQVEIFRKMTVDQKWRLLGKLYRSAKLLHEAGVRERNPKATAQEVHEAWLEVTLGPDLLEAMRASGYYSGQSSSASSP